MGSSDNPNEVRKAIQECSGTNARPDGLSSGKPNGAQKNWTTCEKKACAIVQISDSFDYLFWGATETHVFTDHTNPFHVFAPSPLRPKSPRHVPSSVHRWPIDLSKFDYFINLIEESKNTFADILTKWCKGYPTSAAKSNTVAALYRDIVPGAEDIDHSRLQEVKRG